MNLFCGVICPSEPPVDRVVYGCVAADVAGAGNVVYDPQSKTRLGSCPMRGETTCDAYGPFGKCRFKPGETDMGDKGKRDKGKKEQQKKAQLSPKEKRKKKKEKKNK